MLARLSSKGQLVIPKALRRKLGLQAGTRFEVHSQDGKIVLEPLTSSALERLFGKYPRAGLLGELEEEHRRELADEDPVCA
jgi:AbrB family looped-hinge helix DNA binding protein